MPRNVDVLIEGYVVRFSTGATYPPIKRGALRAHQVRMMQATENRMHFDWRVRSHGTKFYGDTSNQQELFRR